MDKPRRRVVVDIKLEGDDWDEIQRALHQLRTEIAMSGSLSTSSVSGGYGSGWIVTSNEDDSITHDSWAAALDAYLEDGPHG